MNRFSFLTQEADPSRVPVAILNGFLGSGKTRLVNALRRDERLAGTAVAVNEFGEISLDHEAIDHGDDETVVMANGCLCCNLAGEMKDIWDLLQSLGAPALIHCGTTAIGAGEPGRLGFRLGHARPIPNIDDVAADFPRLAIGAAHPGWPWTEELIAVAIHKANVSIDISGWGPKYVRPALKHDMRWRLQDKVLFGSDYSGWSPGQCCDEWEMEGFKPGVIEKLFQQNVKRILKLEDATAQAVAAAR